MLAFITPNTHGSKTPCRTPFFWFLDPPGEGAPHPSCALPMFHIPCRARRPKAAQPAPRRAARSQSGFDGLSSTGSAGLCGGMFMDVFLGDGMFYCVAVVSLGSPTFAVPFCLSAFVFFCFWLWFWFRAPQPPFVPAVGLIHSCPANALPPRNGPCLQTYCHRRRHVAASSEPSVVRRAMSGSSSEPSAPSSVRVVAAPAQSWAGFERNRLTGSGAV